MNTSSKSGFGDSPITDFSQCHVGNVAQLDALDSLPPLLAPDQRARLKAALRQVARGHEPHSIPTLQHSLRTPACRTLPTGNGLPAAVTNHLGRNARHLAALGISLHRRHVKPVDGYIQETARL